MEETGREEKLNRIYEFLEDMAEAGGSKKSTSMPKWLMQGFFYGLFLALLGYLSGAIAVNAVPDAFPATLPVVSGALGFLASIGIAYTKDIKE